MHSLTQISLTIKNNKITYEAKSVRNIWSYMRWGGEPELPNCVPNPYSVVVLGIMLPRYIMLLQIQPKNRRKEANNKMCGSQSPSRTGQCSDGCSRKCSCSSYTEYVFPLHICQAYPCQSHKEPYWSQVHPQ